MFMARDDFNINQIERHAGRTPFHAACVGGNAHIVSLLMEAGCNINLPAKDGQSGLWEACCQGSLKPDPAFVQIAKMLLARDDVNINMPRIKGPTGSSGGLGNCTSLYVACEGNGDNSKVGSCSVSELLSRLCCLLAGTPPDQHAYSRYATHPISFSSHPLSSIQQLVRMLLAKKNVDVNMATLRGATPMFIASQGGNVKVVAALLEHPHCDINKPMTQSRVTPFYIACSRRHFPVLEELVKRSDCDINRADRSGLTPLHLAVRNGIVRLAAMLLRRPDCDLNPSATVSWPVNQATGLPTGAKLPPPLISACALNHTGIAMSLLARGALGVGGGDHDGTTFFHVAASHCHLETVNAILAVFPRKDAWHTFLVGACGRNRSSDRGEVLEILGAVPDVIRPVFKFLHKPRNFVNVKAADENGMTAMDHASTVGLVQYLAMRGGTPHAKRLAMIRRLEALEAEADGETDEAAAGKDEAAWLQCGLPSCVATGTKRCAACKAMYYCSRDHQRSHWNVHKGECCAGKSKRTSGGDVD